MWPRRLLVLFVGGGMSLSQWLQLVISGITPGSIYALVGLGYVTIYRTSRVVNFAQGSFVMLGALITYSLLTERGLPFWLAGILSIVIVVADRGGDVLPRHRPIIKVSLVSMILVTIGVSLLLENLALVKWGGYGLGIPPFPGDRTLHFWKLTFEVQSIWVIGVALLLFLGLYLLSNRTRVGKQMTATASDPLSASLSGISTTTHGRAGVRDQRGHRRHRRHLRGLHQPDELRLGRHARARRVHRRHRRRLGLEQRRHRRRADGGHRRVAGLAASCPAATGAPSPTCCSSSSCTSGRRASSARASVEADG